jgi:hypothetical protein
MAVPQPAQINPAQYCALRDTKLGRTVEIGARGELRDLGLIKQGVGGWMLTPLGELTLAAGKPG